MLIHWEDDAIEAAMEDLTNIQEQFLEFHLEDKVGFSEESVVRRWDRYRIKGLL